MPPARRQLQQAELQRQLTEAQRAAGSAAAGAGAATSLAADAVRMVDRRALAHVFSEWDDPKLGQGNETQERLEVLWPSWETKFCNAFAKVCRRLATLGGNGRGDQETRNAAARLSRRIFAAFDAQETDDVDFVEVAAGLAVLAPASMDDKIEAAFALYDVTRGGVAFEELRGYLLAVYRVLRACSASLALRIHQAGGPLKLADDTAAACFRSRRLGDDAPLDVQLFKEFVCEGISAAYEL